MNQSEIPSCLVDKINNARSRLDVPPLLTADSLSQFIHTYHETLEFAVVKEGGNEESIFQVIDNVLNNEELSEKDQLKRASLLSRFASHVFAQIEEHDEEQIISVQLFNHSLSLEQPGPFIDGDMVLQGSCSSTQLAPAFCVVESTRELDSPFQEILTVAPWSMMVTPAVDDGGEGLKFVIPISIGDSFEGHHVRVRVFVDDPARIPYDGETKSFDMTTAARDALSCAVSFQATVGQSEPPEPEVDPQLRHSEEQGAEDEEGGGEGAFFDAMDLAEHAEQRDGEELLSRRVLKDIRIAYDYDDVVSLQAEGFELVCTQVTADGPNSIDQEHLWKFHVLAAYSPADGAIMPGVEDIAWVKCLKSLGTLPALPFFEILHDYDLSEPDDDCSIYIAVKIGPNPRFRQLVMLSSLIEFEDSYAAYVASTPGVYRPAPAEVSRAFGGPCGILLLLDGQPHSKPESAAGAGSITHSVAGGAVRDDLSHMTPASAELPGGGYQGAGSDLEESDEDDDDDDEEEEDYEDEEDIVAGLMQQISELESEKSSLASLNMELQKKAVALIAREKAMQGQTAARTAPSEGGAAAAEQPETTSEHNQEKEKQYGDTLHLIVEDRVKLNDQLKEFDQLALDLQTRLDDKELKFNGIDLSFKKFKKEILLKAENSRTGHTISKKQIKQFEAAEQRREEDLEKVRLRNISLRTTYRKMERTLRAREQLAEGLHMIDFEQLKIENQTLNEKIEERNEELAKLKRKKTTTVQVLTHVREKLRFVEQANKVVQAELSGLEIGTTSLRNAVTADKLQRDAIRMENGELKAKQGFASSDLLLADFEQRRSRLEQLRANVAELKDRYGILVRQVNLANSRSTATPWNLLSGSQTTPLTPGKGI